MKKVLLITGVHPDEKYSKLICEEVKRLASSFKVSILEFPTTGFNSRNLSLNLNRESDQKLLTKLHQTLDNLYSSCNEYDLILDVHNSKNINNCILISQKNRFMNLKVPSNSIAIDFLREFCVCRNTNFRPISGIIREDHNVNSYTIEINNMDRSNTIPKDVDFLMNSIMYLLDTQAIDNSSEETNKNLVLSDSSVLHSITLKHTIKSENILKIKYLTESQIQMIDSFEDDELHDIFFSTSELLEVKIIGYMIDEENSVVHLDATIKGD